MNISLYGMIGLLRFYGKSTDGIGIYVDLGVWVANLSFADNIRFIDGTQNFEETKELAIKEYEKMKEELE